MTSNHPLLTMKTLILLAAAMALPQYAGAQRPPWLSEYMKPAVYGRITDSASGRPIPGVRMQVDSMIGIPGSDKEGWYLLFGQRPGLRHVSFYCPSHRRISWHKVAEKVVDIGPRTDSLVNFQITLTGCSEPPSHTWSGEFRGHYTSGFESSDFTPCGGKIEQLAGTAYEQEKQYVWVEDFARDAFKGIRVKNSEKLDKDYPTVYVRWRATLTGPGSYGHLGVGMYKMWVEKVLETRLPEPGDCR